MYPSKFKVPTPVPIESVGGAINKSTKSAHADKGILRTDTINIANVINTFLIIFYPYPIPTN